MKGIVKVILFLPVLAVIAGCSTFQTKPVEQQIVYVDRVVQADPPKPADVAKPDLPVNHITKTTPDDDVIKAYEASYALLLSYSSNLEDALKPFWDAYNKAQAAKAAAATPQGKK